MLRRKPISVAVATALGVASASGAFINTAYAEGEAVMEEIIVTGSRIKRADLNSASPISVLTHEDITVRGYSDVGYMLQRMPSMGGSPIGTTTNNGGNGSVQVDLRGLGVERTLTLVNGRRTVDGGDYQTIPSIMIERIEILKDGASAVYGADAVAGVVNIITRRNFDGFELQAQTTDFFDIDSGSQDTYSFIAGKSFDGGNFMFGAEFVDQEATLQGDTDFKHFQSAFNIYPSGCENQFFAPYDGTPTGGCYIGGSSRIPEGRHRITDPIEQRFNDDGTPRLLDPINNELNQLADETANPAFVAANGVPTFSSSTTRLMGSSAGLIPDDGRLYNFAPVNFIQTPYERTNLFGELNYEPFKGVQLQAGIRYNRRDSEQKLAPMPYDSRLDPAFAGTLPNPIDPLTGLPLRQVPGVDADGNAIQIYTADQSLGTVVPGASFNGISKDNFYNPTGLDIVDARRRVVETNRSFEQAVEQFQVDMTLSGEFNDISWEVFYVRGWRDRSDADLGQFSGARLTEALGPSADLDGDGTPECYGDITDVTTLIAGCVPLNLIGGAGTITQDQLDFVGVNLVDNSESNLTQTGISISGSHFDLPGGKMGWAVGYEYRDEDFTFRPDSAKQTDSVTGNTGLGTEGGFIVNSWYGELLLPLFDNGTQSLTLNLGVRYDDFNTFGSDTTVQGGIEFQVLDSLKLRATGGEVFRAPNVSESFAGQQDSFPQFKDPCNVVGACAFFAEQDDSQVLARVGGNPDLQAETGDTITAGVVWTPEFGLGDFSLTVDYWETEIEDLISTLGVQQTLDDCHVNGITSACSRIVRRPDNTIDRIFDFNLNIADARAEGIDVEARFDFDTSIGQFDTQFLWSHILERERTAFQGAATEDLEGKFTSANGGEAWAEDKISYSIAWSRNNWRVTYLGEYISELDGEVLFVANAFHDIDDEFYQDITASYLVSDIGLTVTAGVTNFTDEDPPFVDSGFNASTDPATYRIFGRGYFLRLAWSPPGR